MFPSINPLETKAWKKLEAHYQQMKTVHLRELFAQDPDRFTSFSNCIEDIVIDYSKNIITKETVSLLLELAEEARLPEAIEAMFKGEKINQTENRAVWHVALRNCFDHPMVMAKM
jgi:glucose-6-phosphate isomerase